MKSSQVRIQIPKLDSQHVVHKPENINTSKKQPRYSCFCEICTNVYLKIGASNSFCSKSKVNLHIKDKHEAANITICDKGQSKYYKILCINCQCDLFFAHL